MKDIITVATVNFASIWGNKERNLSRIKDYIEAAAIRGAKLIVFPEGALTGYEDEADKPLEEKMQRRLAETIPGNSTNDIAEITKKYGVYVVFGMPERDSQKTDLVYNAAAVCGPEGVIGSYRKIHLTNAELNWAVRGDSPFMFDTPWGPICVGICYDTYEFPELMRYYHANGSRLYVNSTVIAEGFSAQKANISLQYYASILNTYIVSSNMFGFERQIFFVGGSSIIGPANDIPGFHYYAGNPFDSPNTNGEDMVIATIDLTYVDRSAFTSLWHYNPKIGSPNWRPDLYVDWLQEILNNPNWGKQK